MNMTFSLEQISKTGNLNADLIMRHYKLDKTAKFREIKSINSKSKHYKQLKNWQYPPLPYNVIEEKQICFHPIEHYNHQTLSQEKK